MKALKIQIVTCFVLALSTLTCHAQKDRKEPTGSPYFIVQTEDEKALLPLKSTSAKVNVAGVIADVSITQVYQNNGEVPIEALYVFPASTRAAIYKMEMQIGERVILAKIEEKNKALSAYEQAKTDGKNASLLEQQRPNVFQMNVANIMPGDEIKVVLCYTELIVPENHMYTFVFPTVVGPRYAENLEGDQKNEEWIENPYTTENEPPLYAFDMNVSISGGMPIERITSPSHQINVDFSNENTAHVSFDKDAQNGGNKDFILHYQLSGDGIHSGVLFYEGQDENFFLAMIQPPAQIDERQIPPREYVFILDVSGSMSGFPMDVSKSLMRSLLSSLRPSDRFNVLFFAGGSSMLFENAQPVNKTSIEQAMQMIEKQRGGGGTQLLPALKKALSMQHAEGVARSFVILTDGYVAIEQEAFDLVRNNMNQANFFSFGIGRSVNRYLIEGLAHVGMGQPFVVLDEKSAVRTVKRFKQYIEQPVLTNITYQISGLDAYEMEPNSIPDVFGERPLVLIGKYRGKPKGKILFKGISGRENIQFSIDLSVKKTDTRNAAIKYLWAREKIRLEDDYNNLFASEAHVENITQLGLNYNLITNYTSFIAIDSEMRNKDGVVSTIKQALPLPDGVCNYAIGAQTKRRKSIYSIAGEFDTKVEFEEPAVFHIVEEKPAFEGGDRALLKFIQEHIVYPEKAKEKGISGTVFISFNIDVDGSVVDVKVVRKVHPLLDKEALRIIKKMDGKWIAGQQNKKPVKTNMVVPVKFSLN